MASIETTIAVQEGFVVEKTFRIVTTDNFGGDRPNERFVTKGMLTEEMADAIAKAMNKNAGENSVRFYKVVPHITIKYKLKVDVEP